MNDDVKRLFGYNLKRLRKNKKMSQMQLAETVGMTFTFISDIENGKKWVSPESVEKLAVALDIEIYNLFLPEGYVKPEDRKFTNFFEELEKTYNALKKKYN